MTPIWIGTSLLLLFCVPIAAWDYSIERVESLNSSDTEYVIFDVQVQRADCSDFVINGNITFKSAFTRNPSMYYHTTHIYYSALGSNQYNRLPTQFPRESFCFYINNSYRKYFMNSLKRPVSNFPHTNDLNEDLCKAFQSDHDLVFNVHNFMIDKSVMPPYVQEGMYKMEILIDLDDVVIAGVILHLRTDPESDV